MRLVLETNDGEQILEVISDGEARFKVKGRALRDLKNEYETDDDFHVVGLVLQHFGAFNSQEYLRRRLNEREPTRVVGSVAIRPVPGERPMGKQPVPSGIRS